MAVGAQFAAALQALLKKLQQTQIDIGDKEKQQNQLYQNQQTDTALAYPQALKSNYQNMADRGLAQSGIGLGQVGKITGAKDKALGEFGMTNSNMLADLAKAKLAAQTDYDTGFANIQIQDAAANANAAITTGAPPVTVGPGSNIPVGTKPVVNAPPAQVQARPPAVMGNKGASNPKIPFKQPASSSDRGIKKKIPAKTIAKRPPTSRLVNY